MQKRYVVKTVKQRAFLAQAYLDVAKGVLFAAVGYALASEVVSFARLVVICILLFASGLLFQLALNVHKIYTSK